MPTNLKLANTQGRLTALENELSYLRPVLLMQPYAVTRTRQHHKRNESAQNADSNVEADATDATEGEPSTPKERARQDSQGQYYRPREGEEQEGHHKSRRAKKRSYFKRTPMLTDARAEHLLLAARRIGRRRTTMLAASTFQPLEPEPGTLLAAANAKGKGRAFDGPATSTPSSSFTPTALTVPLPTTPKTPSKSPSRPPYPPGSPGFFAPAGHAYLVPAGPSGSGRPPGGRGAMPTPFFVPGPYTFYGATAYPGFPPVGASPSRGAAKQSNQAHPNAFPSKSTEPSTPANRQRQQEKQADRSTAATASPLTPLDKLLSAAQTVFSPSATPTTKGKRTNASVPAPTESAEDPSDGSPTPKRRRLEPEGAGGGVAESSSAGLNRRASALDVLADQAIGSEAADVRDSRSRSGSMSSVASAASKSSTVPPPRRTSTRVRGQGPSMRQTRRSKVADEGHDANDGTETNSPKGKAKSTLRRKAAASRGSSLDPPIRLQDARSRSRSGTPRRSQLRDIEEGDEDAPHEVDTEEPHFEPQQSRAGSASTTRSQTRRKAAKNGKAKSGDGDDELDPESEEEQDRREEVCALFVLAIIMELIQQ